MQSINFRRCARTVCVLVAGLSAALSGLSFAQSPQTDADRIVAYIAPALLGSGLPALGDAGIETLAAALRLHVEAVDLIGGDVRITATPASLAAPKRGE